MAQIDFIVPQGVLVAETSEIQNEVQQEYIAAFGAGLSLSPDTPQGVLMTQEVLNRVGALSNILQIFNQINPNIAEGIFLDAIYALTGGKREQETHTEVDNVLLTGFPSAIIPAGAIAAVDDADAEQFALVNSVVLDNAGQGIGVFRAIKSGAIQCVANMLTKIVVTSVGWETVNNPDDAFYIGTEKASDETTRSQRRNELAVQGAGINEAIMSYLYALAGVRSVRLLENVENFTQTIEGISLVEHSIWVCVDGGSDQQIAEALLYGKSAGCNWNGSEIIDVESPSTGQVYEVKFDRPDEVPVMVRVTVRASGGVSDPVSLVKKAILDYANGLINGETGLTIGVDVSAFELSGAITSQTPLLFVSNVQVALENVSPTWLYTISIDTNKKALITEANIAVTVA